MANKNVLKDFRSLALCYKPGIADGVSQFETLADALAGGRWSPIVRHPESPTVRGVVETDALSGIRRRDQLLSRRYRVFGPRYTEATSIIVPRRRVMYLSRLQLNANNRQVWRNLISNPYKVHQMIMRGFPDETKRDEAQVLHRLEVRDEDVTLLVQSTIEPDWSMVDQRYLAPVDPVGFLPNPAVKPLKLPLQAGQVLSFRLCANPTIKKVRRAETDERRNSNRVPLVHEHRQLEWLQQRAEVNGFRVLRVTVTQSQKQTAWKKEIGRPITLYTVQLNRYWSGQSFWLRPAVVRASLT